MAEHYVPRLGCSCGWRSLPTLAAAARYALDHKPAYVAEGYVSTAVSTVGRAISGAFDDVDGIARSAGLRFDGPMYLPTSLSPVREPLL